MLMFKTLSSTKLAAVCNRPTVEPQPTATLELVIQLVQPLQHSIYTVSAVEMSRAHFFCTAPALHCKRSVRTLHCTALQNFGKYCTAPALHPQSTAWKHVGNITAIKNTAKILFLLVKSLTRYQYRYKLIMTHFNLIHKIIL